MKLLYILDHWFRRRNHSKAFLIWSFCGSIVQWSGTICAKLEEDTIGDSSVKLTCLDGGGLMLWLFVGPSGVYLLDFLCSRIQFNLLLGPCPCFVSLLCLDLYVLGDDALIS